MCLSVDLSFFCCFSSSLLTRDCSVSTEAWAYFPTARRRLLDLVMNSGVDMPVFLSGDVHFSEMTGIHRQMLLLPSHTSMYISITSLRT